MQMYAKSIEAIAPKINQVLTSTLFRDGPPPDFSGIPDFFFFTSVEKKT